MAPTGNSSGPPSSAEEVEGIASHFVLKSPSPPRTPNTNNGQKKQKKSSSSSSKKESIFLFLVGIFVLNAINGQKIVQSVNSQFDDLQEYMMPAVMSEQNSNWQLSDKKNESTAIIVTSSWIPSHPSTYMIEMVINSTERLKGLSSTAPIFITVDHFRFSDFLNTPPDLEERISKLEQYTINLMNLYLTNPRIHILPATEHLHIGGSVMKSLNLIERHYPSVKYVHYLQHDFYFCKDVDQLALENAMDYYPKINYILFPKPNPARTSRECAQEQPINYNMTIHSNTADMADNKTARQLTLYPTPAYSDNNHLVRLSWYKANLGALGFLGRAPENPMQVQANFGCWGTGGRLPLGLYLYHTTTIGHLDGRHTASTP